jgi:hypothetical protein
LWLEVITGHKTHPANAVLSSLFGGAAESTDASFIAEVGIAERQKTVD